MKALRAALACVAAMLLFAPAAQADFGLLPGAEGFNVTTTEEDGSIASQAGSHPYAMTTEINFKLDEDSPFTDGDVRDIHIDLPPGFIENPSAISQCSQAQFDIPRVSPFQESLSGESCPNKSQIGVVTIRTSFGGGSTRTFGVFNLTPPSGAPSQFGFSPYGVPVTFTPHIRETASEYGLTLDLRDFPQQLDVYGFEMTIWGNPWLIGHDRERGNCLNEIDPEAYFGKDATLEHEPQTVPPSPPFYEPGTCSIGDPKVEPPLAYLTLPGNCDGPITYSLRATSWQEPAPIGASSVSHDEGGDPQSLSGCDKLSLFTEASALPSTNRAASATGLDFNLDVNQGGLLFNFTPGGRLLPGIRAPSQVKKAVVTLPEGMTINPSVGSGLGVCAPAQYAAETASSPPGAGCPNASKIGEVTVQSPLFKGTMGGALFLAQPDEAASGTPGAENPFDSLIALYLVAKAPDRGVMIRLAGKVSADPASGRLVATFDNLPQLPYFHFNVRFRDGQRSPLATPAACGSYSTQIDFSGWLDPNEIKHSSSAAELTAGIGGGPCPATPAPFTPQAEAGMLNRNAGSYTPFYLHLTRSDAEQEITSYSAQLPPGLLGKLAEIPYCPEAAIEAAKRKSGFAETAVPSCPAASSIGHTLSGYGLGSVLAYAPGGLYLAGPYHGAPFSIVAINAATVGPFDLGVIVVRSAIKVHRQTAQVSVHSQGSDPIPHIVKGIPLHLRDVRVYIDRPNFTLNPTSCEHFSTTSFLSGSGARFFDSADDSFATAASPFQVSNCSALGFAPRFAFTLKGGTRRGNYPALRAVVRSRLGHANIGKVSITLPPVEFLAQEHLNTICTRAQFEANGCPAGSIYGHARAFTPLLAEPLEGPVYLRSNGNERPLPDLVASLHGQVDIDVVGRIDSFRRRIRARFDVLPDAPVSKFVMTLNGGRRGILVNAGNLCSTPALAQVQMIGQNNRGATLRPRLANAKCAKDATRRHKRGR